MAWQTISDAGNPYKTKMKIEPNGGVTVATARVAPCSVARTRFLSLASQRYTSSDGYARRG